MSTVVLCRQRYEQTSLHTAAFGIFYMHSNNATAGIDSRLV